MRAVEVKTGLLDQRKEMLSRLLNARQEHGKVKIEVMDLERAANKLAAIFPEKKS